MQRGPDYQQLLADAQSDLDRQRREADEHAAMLRQEAQRAQAEASAARSQARGAAAGAEFERERNERLGAQLRDQGGQLEATMAGNTKLQVPRCRVFAWVWVCVELRCKGVSGWVCTPCPGQLDMLAALLCSGCCLGCNIDDVV